MLHTDLPPAAGAGGGVRHQVAGLCSALADRGHEIVAHVLTDDGARWPFTVRCSPWARICGESRPRKIIIAPFAFATTHLSGFDVVHAHGDSELLVRRDIPVVRTFYGSARDEARYTDDLRQRFVQGIQFGAELLARRVADRTVGISKATEAAVGQLDRVIPCAVDLQRFRPGAKAEEPTIVFIGTMGGRKRGHLVLTAFRDVLRPRFPSAQLVLIAPDAESGPGVTAIPDASDEEVARHLRRAWLFTLPSSYEGFGVPYIEAMASATTVLATPNAGASELLAHSEAGLIVSEHALPGAICRLLARHDERDRRAQAGLAQSRRYGWPNIAAAYEDLYGELVRR